MSINQVKKTSTGGFSPCQAPIETNILNIQIKACTYLLGYYPLSHKSTPIKEQQANKENLYGQITLQGQQHDNKSPKIGQRWHILSIQDHENEALK